MFGDFVNWFTNITAPVFTFFAQWWFLIVPFTYIESSYFIGKICRNLMLKKGYTNERRWFLTGMLFNIFGLGVCGLMPYNVQPIASAQPDVLRCQYCGGMNTQNTVYCRHCGSKMN